MTHKCLKQNVLLLGLTFYLEVNACFCEPIPGKTLAAEDKLDFFLLASIYCWRVYLCGSKLLCR
jgi:hypothetical protein